MIRHPLERAYKLLAQGLEKNDKQQIQLSAEIEAQNTNIGNDRLLGFDFLSHKNQRLRLALELDKEQINEWDAAVAEATDAIQILKV